MKKIKIGHIGVMHDHSSGIIGCLRKFPDIFEIVGVVAENSECEQKAKKQKAFEGLQFMSEEELLATKELDAVTIESFELNLLNIAEKCVKRGLHMHIDKPAGNDIEQWERILKEAKRKNLVVHMGYMYRYNPAVIKIQEDIKAGRLGEIYCIEAQMDCEHNAEKRQWLSNFKGGMMFFLGCHLVDLIYRIQGMPEEIIPLNHVTGIDGVTAEDFGTAVFNYKNGVSIAKSCAAEVNGFMRRQLVVCGSKGTVELKPFEYYGHFEDGSIDAESMYTDMFVSYKKSPSDWHGTGEKTTYGPVGRYDRMMTEFAEYVRGEKENPFTYEYEYMLQKLVLKSCGYDINYKKEIIL